MFGAIFGIRPGHRPQGRVGVDTSLASACLLSVLTALFSPAMPQLKQQL